MKHAIVALLLTFLTSIAMAQTLTPNQYTTPQGTLSVTHIGHGSLLLQLNGKNIFVDPYGQVADYANFPKADLVLITHEHGDHLDKQELAKIVTEQTAIIGTATVAKELERIQVMKNGDNITWNNIEIEAVPAYNIAQKRPDGQPFHPKGSGNGYVLNFDTFRVYIAGDTEFIPEMNGFGAIDIAFLPKNLPYTMSDEMFVEAAKALRPKVLYPYHYFEIDKAALQEALPGIEVK